MSSTMACKVFASNSQTDFEDDVNGFLGFVREGNGHMDEVRFSSVRDGSGVVFTALVTYWPPEAHDDNEPGDVLVDRIAHVEALVAQLVEAQQRFADLIAPSLIFGAQEGR